MSDLRKIKGYMYVTERQLEIAREDFISNMGMTPEEFQTVMADDLSRAFDRAVEEGKA